MAIPIVWRQVQPDDTTRETWRLFWGSWVLAQVQELEEGGSVIAAFGGRDREMNMGRDDAMSACAMLVAAHFVAAANCCLNFPEKIERKEVPNA